jgi:hypothetical protein
MPRKVAILAGLVLAVTAPAMSQNASVSSADADFVSRCKSPGVIRCWDFDDPAQTDAHVMAGGGYPKLGQVVKDIKASGSGSLRFTIPSQSHENAAGSFWLDFADDYSVQFGEGGEFYIQWRQRFSPTFLTTPYQKSGGWKQIIIGEGDREGFTAKSCTQLEIVVQNTKLRGIPRMYHSCGGKDESYDPLEYYDESAHDVVFQNAVRCTYNNGNPPQKPPCIGYKPDQWMTFQVHVKIAKWYLNDKNKRYDSTVELWVAEEGKPSKLVISFDPRKRTGYDLANSDNPKIAKYGKLWLLPFQTGKDASQVTPEAFTWYDELVISKSKIPDPK